MKRRLTQEERALWVKVNRDTQVLASAKIQSGGDPADAGGKQAAGKKPPPLGPSRPAAAPTLAATAKLAPRQQRAPVGQPAHRPGHLPGVDRRTAERLRRGKMPIEARLDLHGHNLQQAHQAVNAFIAAHYAAGHRCLLVITGKGNRQQDGRRTTGVLKSALPGWLADGVNRERVLSYAIAQPTDGGRGAMYILLRRHRLDSDR